MKRTRFLFSLSYHHKHTLFYLFVFSLAFFLASLSVCVMPPTHHSPPASHSHPTLHPDHFALNQRRIWIFKWRNYARFLWWKLRMFSTISLSFSLLGHSDPLHGQHYTSPTHAHTPASLHQYHHLVFSSPPVFSPLLSHLSYSLPFSSLPPSSLLASLCACWRLWGNNS